MDIKEGIVGFEKPDISEPMNRVKAIVSDTFLKENATISDVLEITRQIEGIIILREQFLINKIKDLERKLNRQ